MIAPMISMLRCSCWLVGSRRGLLNQIYHALFAFLPCVVGWPDTRVTYSSSSGV
jgi:hypothetical protein